MRRGKVGRPAKGAASPVEVLCKEKSLRFQVRVGNTDPEMIREIASIADSLGIRYFLGGYAALRPQHKDMFLVHFHGSDRVGRLLRAVVPWLVTKRGVACLLLQMIDQRKGMPYHQLSLANPEMVGFLQKVREANHRGRNSYGVIEQVSGEGSRRIPLPKPMLQEVVGPDREREMSAHPDKGTACSGIV